MSLTTSSITHPKRNHSLQAVIDKKLADLTAFQTGRYASRELFDNVLADVCGHFREKTPRLDRVHETGLTPTQALIVAIILQTKDENIVNFQKVACEIYLAANPKTDPVAFFKRRPDLNDRSFRDRVEDYMERSRFIQAGRPDFSPPKPRNTSFLAQARAALLKPADRKKLAYDVPDFDAPDTGTPDIDVPDANDEITAKPVMENPMPKRTEKAAAVATVISTEDKSSSYQDYLSSFGFKISCHREERKLTRAEAAAAVLYALATDHKITPANILRWDQGRSLPSQNEFQALSQVLVDQNQEVVDAEKQLVRQLLQAAYTKSVAASAQNSTADEEDRYLFATKFMELQETAVIGEALLTREKLAAAINDKLTNPLTAIEIKLLTQDKGNFIAGLEAGVTDRPSESLVTSLIQALIIDETAARDLRAALLPAKSMVVQTQSLNGNEGVNGHAKGLASDKKQDGNGDSTNGHVAKGRRSTTEPTDPNQKLKYHFGQIVNPSHVPTKVLAEQIQINVTTLGILFGGKTNPRGLGGFSEKSAQQLTKYINEVYSGDVARKTEALQLYAQLGDAYPKAPART